MGDQISKKILNLQTSINLKDIYICITMSLLLTTNISYAKSLFDATINSTDADISYNVKFSKVQQIFEEFKASTLQTRISGYTNGMDISSNINFRGLPINVSYENDSTAATLKIPEIGFTETFAENTRDESIKKLENWFKSDNPEVGELHKALAKKTAVDFIAGNPNSLMSSMVLDDFESGMEINKFRMEQVSTGIAFASFNQGGFGSKKLSLPFKYRFHHDEKGSITATIPIRITVVDSAESYQTGLGLTYNYPVSDSWGISPAISYGLGGSQNLGSAGSIISGSVTNVFQLRRDYSAIDLVSMLGYYKTLEFTYEGYTINPDISSIVFRNGVFIQLPLFSEYYYIQPFLTDTQYFGSELYINHYNELGFFLGFSEYLKFGLFYTVSSNSSGVTVNFNISRDLW